MKKKIKFHKKSIITGFILWWILWIFKRYWADAIVINVLNILLKLPIIGNLIKKNSRISSYSGSGWKIPEEYKDGYVSVAKEGMTAEDLINAKNGGGSSERVNYNEHWAIFQSWELSGGFERALQSEYNDNFRLSWINDSVYCKKAMMGMIGGMTLYAMDVKTKDLVAKRSARDNLSLCMEQIKKNDNWLYTFNNMHKIVVDLFNTMGLNFMKNRFKEKNINPDSSWLYKSRELWKKTDEQSIISCKNQFAEWCENTVLKVNEMFRKDTNISLF